MPVPPGYSQVPGNKNRYRNRETGEVITRHEARNRGARYLGFRNEAARRASPRATRTDNNYYRSFIDTNAGRYARQKAMEQARTEGRKFRESEFQSRVIAMRNAAPTRNNPQGAPAFQDFMDDYDLTGADADEIVSY